MDTSGGFFDGVERHESKEGDKEKEVSLEEGEGGSEIDESDRPEVRSGHVKAGEDGTTTLTVVFSNG